MYSVPEAQVGQPLWCQCGQSIAVAGLPPAVGPGQPSTPGGTGPQPVHWARKFLLGYRAVRIAAIIAVLLWLLVSQFTDKLRPGGPTSPAPAGTPAQPDPEAPLPPPEMPWPSGSAPPSAPPPTAQPPPTGGAPSAQMAPGALMGEPLLPKGAKATGLSVAQAPGDPEALVVTFTWPRVPTEDDQDRCFAVVSVGDRQLDVAAMALQGMAGPSPARSGPRDAQIPGPQGVQAASNMDWSVQEPAETAAQRSCRLTVSLRSPLGAPSWSPGRGQPKDVWVQLFDFGMLPPAPLSEPLKKQLTLP